jgi:hypothetical protein
MIMIKNKYYNTQQHQIHLLIVTFIISIRIDSISDMIK